MKNAALFCVGSAAAFSRRKQNNTGLQIIIERSLVVFNGFILSADY